MRITEAATLTYLYNNPPVAARLMGVTETEVPELEPNDDLIYMRFDDDTIWATYPESLGEARNYAHALLEEFVADGGTIES